MRTCALIVLFPLLTLASFARAQGEPAPEDKGTFLGVLFCPLPEVLLDQLPQLPHDSGVLVTHVLPDSPAARGGLRRHDILLRYNGAKIRDGDHMARLIRAGKEGEQVELVLVRAAKERKVTVKLGLGPVLRIASEKRSETPGAAKPGGPSALSVTAVPMDGNRMKITFEYSDAGKFRTLTCAGNAREIDSHLEKLPRRVQNFARVAVQRLRELEVQKPAPSSPSSRRRSSSSPPSFLILARLRILQLPACTGGRHNR